jgi:hypothetical protein
MAEKRYQFVAESIGYGAVNKDGTEALIEFQAGDELMWVNVPVQLLRSLAKMATDLEALEYDAKNGTTSVWHVPASD